MIKFLRGIIIYGTCYALIAFAAVIMVIFVPFYIGVWVFKRLKELPEVTKLIILWPFWVTATVGTIYWVLKLVPWHHVMLLPLLVFGVGMNGIILYILWFYLNKDNKQ